MQQQSPREPAKGTAQQRYDEEEKSLIAAVAEAESAPDSPQNFAKSLEALGLFYQRHNRRVELSATLKRELPAVEKAYPEGSVEFNRALHQIAMGYRISNDKVQAEAMLRRVLALDTKQNGLKSNAVASDFVSLGQLFISKHDFPGAQDFFLQALTIYQLLNEDDRIPQVVRSLSTLAKLENNPDLADSLLAHAIESLQGNPDRNAAQIGMLLDDRSDLAASRGDYVSAINYLQEVVAIDERLLGQDSPSVVADLSNLSNRYIEEGDVGQAEHFAQRALEIVQTSNKDPTKRMEGGALATLARVYEKQKKYPEAEAAVLRAIDSINKERGEDYPSIANYTLQLAELFETEQKYADAEAEFRRTIAIAEKDQGVVGHELPRYLAEYAMMLRNLSRNAEAEKLFQRAKEIQTKLRAPVDPQN